MMAINNKISDLFPLKSIENVIELFKHQLDDPEPDLTLLSIVSGIVENTLCQHENTNPTKTFPKIDYETVDTLYQKFKSIVSIAEVTIPPTTVTKSKNKTINAEPKYATREKIKKVSDVIWNSLLRSSYKDRAHLQSLYSYLTGNKLDSFGMANAVVAGCQVLGYKDVHLALSEDHVWAVFGKTGDDSVEITWHGKGLEDKRGQSVVPGYEARIWKYLGGFPVVCNRYTEVAAIVASINPSLNPTSVCLEVADLQQQLLWMLYDAGHLNNYPMAIGSLGETEEMNPSKNRPTCEQLYQESIQSALKFYKNHHVYPYTYKGGYYYRKEKYREAFSAWADAGDVIRLYNYSRDDEEIYKEFLDIANELIPQIMKTESSGHSARSILRDPLCFANLLRFYDGICQWEEGSQTPILHIGWAKHLVYTISKFDYDIRSQVIIIIKSDYGDDNNNKKVDEKIPDIELKAVESPKQPELLKQVISNGNGNGNGEVKSNEFPMLPTLEELTVACGEKILNPDFLLHGGVPFTESGIEDEEKKMNGSFEKKNEAKDSPKLSPKDDLISDLKCSDETMQSPAPKEVLSPLSQVLSPQSNDDKSEAGKSDEDHSNDTNNNNDEYERPKRPVITLKSRKMKGLKDLLLAEKLNTNAISLQITAQSHIGKKSRNSVGDDSSAESGSRPKRSRRE